MPTRPRKSTENTPDPLVELRELGRRAASPVQPSPAAPVAPSPAASDRPLSDLLDIAVSLTSSLDLKSILDAIVDGIIRVGHCHRGFVILREDDGSLVMFTGRMSDRTPWDRTNAMKISGTIVNQVMDTHEPFVGSDLEKYLSSDSIQAEKIRSALCLPLIYQERLIGVIYADSGFVIPEFLEQDRSVLRAFGAQAVLAIVNARRHGEVLEKSDRLEEQNTRLRLQLSREYTMSGMITKSKRMLEVFDWVEKIARSGVSSVLIDGESGTGKEKLAKAIHERSPRRDGPFEAVNCGGIPAGLVESVLFGHRRGAFTSAAYDKPGVFENANGGTLFLDEIGDMPLEIQVKLLRALEEREITRIGEEGKVRKVDVQIIAATNRDLTRLVAQKEFREDLYFRLNVARIHVPPLRERKEDIIPLAEHFLQMYAEEGKQPRAHLTAEAKAILRENRWVGNVRALKNAMEWCALVQDDQHLIHARELRRYFQSHDLDAPTAEATDGTLHEQLERFEEQIIRRALAQHASNVSNAAKALGISRQQLHLKINKYKIATRDD